MTNDTIEVRPPEVHARDTGANYQIRCPWCGDIHHHGRILGHRVSHCTDRRISRTNHYWRGDPLRIGYVIVSANKENRP